MNRQISLLWLVLFVIACCSIGPAQEVQIYVRADRAMHKLPLLGACLEDVNHEVYGGIDSQMVFGESFQEPPNNPPRGFRVLGGRWAVRDGELTATGIPGDKLISDLSAFENGEVGVEVFIPDRQTTNAGLIVRVRDAGQGMDNFDGYEISLNAAAQHVVLGRHRHNWEHIRNIPCEIPTSAWVPLSVKLNGNKLEILVNGQSVAQHVDDERAILTGTVGLRQFQPAAKYRRLWVKTDNQLHNLSFVSTYDRSEEVSGMWRSVHTSDASGSFSLDQERPFIGRQSQRVTYTSGQGAIGIENQGLNRWGMHFREGSSYEGRVCARADAPAEIAVALQDRDGSRTFAETQLQVPSADWQALDFTLTPSATVHRGRLAILLRQPGSVTFGYVLLQPDLRGRFSGLPVRLDVGAALIEQDNRVLRYGGSMINHAEYRWKKMIGPRDRRPPHAGTWYPYSSNGWGILDFLDFCQRAGVLAIPALNMDETPADLSDFIEYVNGPATSTMGQLRVASGHPEPYHLQYIELGNEERVDDSYFAKFKPLAEAIWARDPQIKIVVGDFLYAHEIQDPDKFAGNPSGITTLAAHRKILQLAKQRRREVWFDVHVGTDGPRPDSTVAGTLSLVNALEKLADGARFKVAVFELNSGNHSQRRALANAIAIQAFARDGRIPIVTSANCLQPDGQNDNGWDQGLLFFNPSQVWLQPPGYVTKLFNRNMAPEVVEVEVFQGHDRLDVLATRSPNNKHLTIQVVNPTLEFIPTQVHVEGFTPRKPIAGVWELAGPLAATNTATQPNAIAPQNREWRFNGTFPAPYRFAPYSITLITLE